MFSPLPNLLDPWRAVDSRWVYTGRLPLSSLQRLHGLLLDAAGDVAFRLAFFRDEERRAVLRCEVSATLKLCCQRCMERLDHEVAVDTLLAFVSGIDEALQLPGGYEPVLVGDKAIRPKELIEDELMLALPQIPMHEWDVCGTKVREVNRAQALSGKTSPFAALAEFKNER